MAQTGILSTFQMGLHNHLDADNGGILTEYSRYGAYRRPSRAGACAVSVPNDAEVSNPDGVWTLLKQFTVNEVLEGTFRIYWEAKNTDNVTVVNTRFYVNGVAVSGIVNDNSNVYSFATYNYDVDLAEGDLLQIWGNSNADVVWVRNFRVEYDWTLPAFGDPALARNVLAAALALTDADAIDITADF